MQAGERRPNPKHSPDVAAMEPSARVKQLANYGAMVDVDPNVPPRRYYRSGLEMVRMANVYLAEGSLEQAYMLYMKFMTLFLEKIRKHPEYGSVATHEKGVNQTMLKEVMPKAEKLKQKLLDLYTKEHATYIANEEKRWKEAEKRKMQERDDAKLAERLQADENKKDGTTPHLTNTYANVYNTAGYRTSIMVKVAPSSYYYNVPQQAWPDAWAASPSAPAVGGVLYPDDFAAEPPRAPPHHYLPSPPLIPPSRPHVSGAYSDAPCGSQRLRPVLVPAALLARFLRLAAASTARSVETCGILAGVLERDQLKITHVVVPKQTGTPDSCVTNNEEEIFHYQDQHNLITLGWIHTHPTQTAFLSSVDLHTQCSYQLMMPEAIAIVCAPKYNETGYFALSPEYGVQYIANCRLGGFHPHPADPPLFHNVTHIRIDETLPVEVVDLRR